MLAARMDANDRDLANLYYAPEPRLKFTRKTLFAVSCVVAGYGALGLYLAVQKWVTPEMMEFTNERMQVQTLKPPLPPPPKTVVDEPPPTNEPPVVQRNTPEPPPSAPPPTPYVAPPTPTPPAPGPAYAALTPTPPLPTSPAIPRTPSQIFDPDWVSRPSALQANAAFPRRAQRMGMSGKADLMCTVQVTGAVAACTVVSETPANYGFGQAALSMAPYFKMRPKTIDGAPVEGAKVRIPVEFSL